MYFVNRTYCDTLEEMRSILDNTSSSAFNISTAEILRSLVEECQVYGNRMEAGLTSQKDIIRLSEEISEKKKELKELKSKVKKLKVKLKIKEREPVENNLCNIIYT